MLQTNNSMFVSPVTDNILRSLIFICSDFLDFLLKKILIHY